VTAEVTTWRAYHFGTWGQVHLRGSKPVGESAGDTTLVLLHESPLSSRVWEKMLPFSGAYRQVLAPDTPGYGVSDPPEGPGHEIPDYAESILAAMESAGVGDMVVVGVHTGASIAIEMAQQSEQVRGVVLSGVALLTPEQRAEYLANWTPPIELTSEGDQFDWALARYHRIWGADTPPWMLNTAIGDLLSVWDRYFWGYQAAFRYDPEPALRLLKQPTLLLDAEGDLLAEYDPLVEAMVTDCRTEIIPGLRGQLHMRAPEETARHLEEFTRAIEK
jgi:pimeloyl-ACP methyl ester carboxylesterase